MNGFNRLHTMGESIVKPENIAIKMIMKNRMLKEKDFLTMNRISNDQLSLIRVTKGKYLITDSHIFPNLKKMTNQQIQKCQ